MSSNLWRHAASLILGAPLKDTGQLCVLLTQRSKYIRFMPSSYVFPGGELSQSDFDPFWQKEYDNLDAWVKVEHPLKSLHNRPQVYERYGHGETWPEVAFRVCAMRELFEECGILFVYDKRNKLCRTIATGDKSEEGQYLLSKQNDVHNSAELFPQLFIHSNTVVPAFWTLREWSNWLTPSFTRNEMRFDTVFFVLCLPHTVQFNLCSKENDRADWISPAIMLASGQSGQLSLPPPQFLELSRLKRFEHLEDLRRFSAYREPFGVVRFCPQIAKIANDRSRRIGVLPGDDLYEKVPGGIAEDRTVFLTDDATIEQCKHKHRALWNVQVTENKTTIWNKMRYEIQNVEPLCAHENPTDCLP